ncbi:MAG: hypothetical protein MJ219_00415 [Mycoplasmoidaceae bacterium]|nr:hypothetical protein [Mycoplasmoidaceae bacterium]
MSAGIIIHPTDNEKEVTLRYDIFGDICGEQIFDELFRNCDGNYAHFISTVSKIFGNSVYRRYQIWVEFKLFKSDKSDKFIFDTIFLNNINEF